MPNILLSSSVCENEADGAVLGGSKGISLESVQRVYSDGKYSPVVQNREALRGINEGMKRNKQSRRRSEDEEETRLSAFLAVDVDA